VWDGRGRIYPKEVAVLRLCRALVVTALTLGAVVPPAAAAPDSLGASLGTMWRTILETPSAQNPFGDPGGPVCLAVDGAVAPFSPAGQAITCQVKTGTKMFVAAWSSECSTLEDDPFFGGDEAELRACAKAVNDEVTTVTARLDDKPLVLTRVTSPLQRLNLPADNIFGAAPGHGAASAPYLSVADGWTALIHPLPPGVHTIRITAEGIWPPGKEDLDVDNTTTIVVTPGR
jgi:hypothetical protein